MEESGNQPAEQAIDQAAQAEAAAAEANDQAGGLVGLVQSALGGEAEGLLGKIAAVLPDGVAQKASQLLDRDGDGNPLNDIAGFAARLTGRD